MSYLLLIAVVYFLHLLLKMNWICTGILFLYGIWSLSRHKKVLRGQKFQEERFFAVSLYLDTVLYAFLKEEKIDGALRDTARTMPEGIMKREVERVAEKIMIAADDEQVMEAALRELEEAFPCKRMRDVHNFMLHVEYYGGEIARPVQLLLEDKGRWERRIQKTMEERKKKRMDVILSVIASLLICGVILYRPVLDIDISTNILVQIITVLLVMIDDLVLRKAQKYLNQDWLALRLGEEGNKYVKKMEELRKYDEQKEKRLSNILGTFALVITGICLFLGKYWIVAMGLFLALFLFQQHRLGHALLRKNLVKEIQYAFPNWLLDLILLLQSENVQIALEKSLTFAPAILRREVEDLLERLHMDPESSEPFHGFLKEFSIPQIHSAMSGLYGLTIGNSHKGDKQMNELVEKNLELLDVAESRKLSESVAGMYLLFLAPVLLASFKLVVDMAILMIRFIQNPML
ncbi:MAG: hypothetical protein J6R94_04200 [Agathobacter sp.]|nr:hypothetical protein [Agathobacter sp.]